MTTEVAVAAAADDGAPRSTPTVTIRAPTTLAMPSNYPHSACDPPPMTTTATDVYEVPEEHREFLAGIRTIVQGKVAPRAADIDRTSEYPWDIRALFGESDILALPF